MLHRTLSPSLCFQSMIVPVSPECSIRCQRLFSSWDTASEPLSPTNRHIRLHPKGFHGLERVDVFVEGIVCKWLFQEGTGITLLLLSEWLYYTELLQRLLFVLLDYIVLFQLNISFLAVWLLAWGSDPLLPSAMWVMCLRSHLQPCDSRSIDGNEWRFSHQRVFPVWTTE